MIGSPDNSVQPKSEKQKQGFAISNKLGTHRLSNQKHRFRKNKKSLKKIEQIK